jgi:DNA replication protein DnaC
MKQHNTNLRQAFAANPSRFVAGRTGHPATVSRPASEIKLFTARRSSDSPSHPLADKFRDLGLLGMARTVSQLNLDGNEGSFVRQLSLLIDNEITDRNARQLARRLRHANLRFQASIAELDYDAVRGFDDALFHELATGQWIADRENAIIEGPTGVGKTWLACALGDKACRDGKSVRYESAPRLVAELAAVQGGRRHSYRMQNLAAVDLLILDDWGLERFTADQRVEIFEVLDRRCGQRSTLIASQHAVEKWPHIIGEPTTSALLVDRLIHNAHRLQLNGASLRQRLASDRRG